MTVSSQISRVSYSGDGVTTVFPVPFRFLVNTDVCLYVDDALKTLTTDYTLAGANDDSGGSLTALVAPGAGTDVVIFRDPDLLQQTEFPPNDPFPSVANETALDKLTMIVQRAFDRIARVITFPDSDSSTIDGELPSAADRALKYFGFDATGSPIATLGTADSGTLAASLANTANPALGSSLVGHKASNRNSASTNITVRQRLEYLDGISPPTAVDDAGAGSVNAYRDATALTAGTTGFVNSAIYAQTNTGETEDAYEWVISSVLHNSSTTSAEHVAIAAAAYKHAGASGTWAGLFQSIDDSGNVNPSTPQIGVEIDTHATGLDNNLQRIQLAIGTSSTATISRGIQLGSNTGFYSIGVNLYGNQVSGIVCGNTGVLGLDVSTGTFSGPAIRMKQDQKLSFDVGDVNQLTFNGSALQYLVSGVQKSALNSDGSISLNGAVTKIVGSVSTGAATPTLTANKPGANAGISAWISVSISGVQCWIPAWGN